MSRASSIKVLAILADLVNKTPLRLELHHGEKSTVYPSIIIKKASFYPVCFTFINNNGCRDSYHSHTIEMREPFKIQHHDNGIMIECRDNAVEFFTKPWNVIDKDRSS